MKYETQTVTKRIPELLGPVDWSHDFAQYFANTCFRDPVERQRYAQIHIDRLRLIDAYPERFQATTDGGSPRCCWQHVVAVGMWDGWPYWRPVPSVCLTGTLGCEWHGFHFLTDIADGNQTLSREDIAREIAALEARRAV